MEPRTLRTRPLTPLLRLRFVAVWTTASVTTLALVVGRDWPPTAGDWRTILPLWAPPAGVLALIVVGLSLRAGSSPARQTLRLDDETVTLPASRLARHPRRLRYDAIRSISWMRVWPSRSRRLMVCDRSGRVGIAWTSWLADAPALADFVRELERRIATADPGGDRVAAVRERAALAAWAASRPPRVTRALIGTIVVVLLVQAWAGPFDMPHLLWLGATARWLVVEGEWHRMATGALLHAGVLHGVVNLAMITMLGPMVEGLIGTWRTVLVYAVAAVAGSAAMLLMAGDGAGVGASGAGFGLVGGLLVLNVTDRPRLADPLRIQWSTAIAILAYTVVLEVGVPRVATAAHVGGMLGGAAVLAWTRPRLHATGPAAASPLVRGVAWLAVAFFAVAAAAGVRAALASSPVDVERRTAVTLGARGRPGLGFEAHASLLLALPGLRRGDLLAIEPLALERARTHGGLSAHVAAAIEQRLGEAPRALALQEEAAIGSSADSVLRRLAALRFEALRAGRLAAPVSFARGEVDATGRVTLTLGTVPADGFTIDALLVAGDRLIAALRVTAGSGAAGRIVSRDPVFGPLPASIATPRLLVVAARARRVDDHPLVGPGRIGWWPMVFDDEPLLPPPLPPDRGARSRKRPVRVWPTWATDQKR